LLKKLLPFALTFVVGAAIGGLFNSFGLRSTPALVGVGPSYRFERRYSCRMHTRDLVAETKPLVILFKPDGHWPSGAHYLEAVHALVTFGADGKVQRVEPVNEDLKDALTVYNQQKIITHIDARILIWDAAERAARGIQFEPEMINGMPVSVTKEVEIHFIDQE
jgi:hypothetical protein